MDAEDGAEGKSKTAEALFGEGEGVLFREIRRSRSEGVSSRPGSDDDVRVDWGRPWRSNCSGSSSGRCRGCLEALVEGRLVSSG